MTKARLAVFALLGLLVVLLIGYLWGASGRRAAEQRVGMLEVRLRATEAQRGLSVARVDLFELNYGQASRHLEEARHALDLLVAAVDREGPREAAEPAQQAATLTRQAQQLLAQMDQAAGSRAGQAITALDRVRATLPPQ